MFPVEALSEKGVKETLEKNLQESYLKTWITNINI